MKFSFKATIAVLLSLILMANGPQQGDLIELSGALNIRSNTDFRKSSKNLVGLLKSGTKAVIEKSTKTNSGYGICVKPLDQNENSPCRWIYYNPRRPNMVLYRISDPQKAKQVLNNWKLQDDQTALQVIKSVQGANYAQTLKEVPSITDRNFNPPPIANIQPSIPESNRPLDLTAGLNGFASRTDSLKSGAAPVTADAPLCTDCMTSFKEGETCDSSNDYLESTINSYFASVPNKSPIVDILSHPSEGIISNQCIESSMRNFKERFKQCSAKETSLPKDTVKRACLSVNYKSLVAKSTNLVASCMKDFMSTSESQQKSDLSSIFKLINHESGFHVNSVSWTNASGVGQLTGDAISDVNDKVLGQVRNHLNEKSECKALSGIIDIPMTNSCDRISIEKGNPASNLVYTFAYQAFLRESLDGSFFNNKAYNKFFSEIPPQLKEKMLSELTAWSHNTGAGGMSRPLSRAILAWKNKQIKSESDLQEFYKLLQNKMKTNPHPKNDSDTRRKETSEFYSKMQNDFKARIGGTNTCVNM